MCSMIRVLKCDLNKTMVSFGFASAILATFMLCFTETVYTDISNSQSFSVLEALLKFDNEFKKTHFPFNSLSVFKNALSGYSAMFLPILSAFPFIFSQSAERTGGNIRLTIFRTQRLKYYFSKFLCAVLCGGICIMAGILLFGLLSLAVFPAISTYTQIEITAEAPDEIFMEFLKKLLSAFIYGCTSALPAFFLSSFCRNRYIILCLPFLMRYMNDTIIRKITAGSVDIEIFEKIFPFESYAPSQIPYISSSKLYSVIAVSVISAVIVFFGYVAIMERRVDRGE